MKEVTLVTGGAGFIGSEVVTQLLSQGACVRVLDDLSTGAIGNVPADAYMHVGTVLDSATVRAALRDVTTVYHLACRSVRHSLHSPMENFAVNAVGASVLLGEARRCSSVQRIVHVSSSEVYGSAIATWKMDELHPTMPTTPYGAGKLAGEALARAYHRSYGLPVVVVRPFNSYGPRSHCEGDCGEVIPRFIGRIKAGRPPVIFGDGSQRRDFTYVSDTARGIIAAGLADVVGETINLGSGDDVSIEELARRIAWLMDSTLEAEHEAERPADVRRLCADSSKARRLLGWKPLVSFDDGLRLLLAWYETQKIDWTNMPLLNWQRTTAMS